MSFEIVKQLRDETGHSISKCQDALKEAGNDIEKAREVLREKGSLTAEKKEHRDLNSGVVESYIHNTNKMGSIVEVLCETDFVAKNEDFIKLAKEIAIHSVAFQPKYVSRDDIEKDVMDKIMEELKSEIDTSKPADIQEKILEGMVDSKLKEFVLLEQLYLKDDTRTIKNIIDENIQKFGERIKVGKIAIITI